MIIYLNLNNNESRHHKFDISLSDQRVPYSTITQVYSLCIQIGKLS